MAKKKGTKKKGNKEVKKRVARIMEQRKNR